MAKKKNNESLESTPLFSEIDFSALREVKTITNDKIEKIALEVLDFSSPNRELSCIEKDFPIIKVNNLSAKESTGPCTKPIYKMNKWWARRRSSVFRQILISSALKSPKDALYASQLSWGEMYRKSHQKTNRFNNLSVLDPFMGGGTTVIEASRLGFDVTGVDLNPIAWWVVRNQINSVPFEELLEALKKIESKLKPKIEKFYKHTSPWLHVYPESDEFRKSKSEIVYAFWQKHIPCIDPHCNHLTPQLTNNVISEKKFKIKAYENCVCPDCGSVFDIELAPHRMAPAADFVLSSDENQFIVLDSKSADVSCPSCFKKISMDSVNAMLERKASATTKSVNHTLMISKDWCKGISGSSKDEFGGYFGSSAEQDKIWFEKRRESFKLIEVRGDVPTNLKCTTYAPSKNSSLNFDEKNLRLSRNITCGKCGRVQDPLESLRVFGKLAPLFPIAIHGFDPIAKKKKFGYNGRFFDYANYDQFLLCANELHNSKELWEYIPTEEVFYSNQIYNWSVNDHGYRNWHHMFNPRQLYSNALLLKEITEDKDFSDDLKSQLLGAFQNFLRHNCMFTLWNIQADQLEPHFSNNNYRPKAMPIENSVFSPVGRGSFRACLNMVVEGMKFLQAPYDLKINDDSQSTSKTEKVASTDKPIKEKIKILCQSSTDLKKEIKDSTIDLVITDPPFGDLVDYSELADFFLVWLHKPFKKIFKELHVASESPKTLEVVSNPLRNPGMDSASGKKKADSMYDRLLTLCWKECHRVLKSTGLLAFTFHHSKDEAWVDILDSLFKSGFELCATYPVRSDSSKGQGQFGARKIEFDIIHVCRKRETEPTDVYWATLRKRIIDSVRSHAAILAQHRLSGLHLADIEVIIRGEVLQEYSKHYGRVKKNLAGDLVTVKEILLEANAVALSLLLEQEDDKIPELIDFNTKVFLSLMREGQTIDRTSATKRLKGSGITLEALISLGWLKNEKRDGQRVVQIVNISERWNSLTRKKTVVTDLDQAHFAINCCIGNKQLDGKNADLEDWVESNYKILLPSTIPLLKYMETNHFGADYKQAIGMAYRTLERTLNKIKESDGEFKKISDQLTLF